MKFQVLSDLHGKYRKVFPKEKQKDTVLFLAGDIEELVHHERYLNIVTECSNIYKHVIIVAGNHEYYGLSIDNANDMLLNISSCFDNVSVLNNDSIIIDDVYIFGGTMWSDFNKSEFVLNEAKNYMNDYTYIKGLEPIQTVHIMKDFIKKLKKFLHERDASDKIMVMSHHAPSFKSVSENFKGNFMNGAFCSDLEDLISSSNIQYWIHGHVHTTFDYMIDNTRILCNPYGYSLTENPLFQQTMILEI